MSLDPPPLKQPLVLDYEGEAADPSLADLPDDTPPRALISGASIAGCALAYWLLQDGWHVTLVERAPRLRTGGLHGKRHV